MKIYNEVIIDMNTGETIYEDKIYGACMLLLCIWCFVFYVFILFVLGVFCIYGYLFFVFCILCPFLISGVGA